MQSLGFMELVSLQWLNNVVRYLLFAGGAFLLFWKWSLFPGLKRLYPKPDAAQSKREFLYSLRTTFLFLIPTAIIISLQKTGISQIYMELDAYSLWWYAAVFPLMFFIHETYFYWSHRLMHGTRVYRHLHHVHHLSKNPSPFAAFSFDVGEALIQSIAFIIISLSFPIHFTHIFFFTIFSLGMNVYGHLGVEVVPEKWQNNAFFKHINGPRSHSLHHRKYNGNYSLYVNWWDKWMGTELKD